MAYIRLNDIDITNNIGNRVFAKFMLKDIILGKRDDGVTDVMTMTICDSNIEIKSVKLFDVKDYHKEFAKNGTIFKGALDIRRYDKSKAGYSVIIYNMEYESSDNMEYLQVEERLDDAIEYINQCMDKLRGTIYFDIVGSILVDKSERFKKWAAASSIHHYKIGGLAVHTYEVTKMAIALAENIQEIYGSNMINEKLVIAGSILHDMGKCDELDTDTNSGTVKYSVDASLETHIISIYRTIEKKAMEYKLGRYKDETDENKEEIEREEEQLRLLQHCILSHHGKLEYGSPIAPSIPEAVIINTADGLSADMYRFEKTFKAIGCKESSSEWLGGKIDVKYKDSSKGE